MFKRNFVFLFLFFIPIVNVFAFNPETVPFSNMRNVKSWIASRYQQDERGLRMIQERLYCYVPYSDNPYLSRAMTNVASGADDGRFFGKNTLAIHSIDTPFLQHIKTASAAIEGGIIVLDIAVGKGNHSWEIPLAFEGNGNKLFVNELSKIEIGEKFDETFARMHDGIELGGLNKMYKLQGDFRTAIPAVLIGRVDVLRVRMVEHYFNPIVHEQLMDLAYAWLKEGGGMLILLQKRLSFFMEIRFVASYMIFIRREEV